MSKNYNDVFELKEEIVRKIDTAYSKGYGAGYKDRSIEIEFDEDVQKAYQKGLNDAWECARKVHLSIDEDGLSIEVLQRLFGTVGPVNVLRNFSASEAVAKIKEYEDKKNHTKCEKCGNWDNVANCCRLDDCVQYSQFEPKEDDEIKVGDEVMHIEKGNIRIVTKIVDKNYVNYIDSDGTVGYIDPTVYKKTGRHYDIQGLFDQMKNE